MASPFMGEVRLMAFNFAPKTWLMCNGQTLSISQNTALFALLGTYYGGDGIRTFSLPNLQGRTPLSQKTDGTFQMGQTGGEVNHTLTLNEMPNHLHLVNAANSATSDATAGNFFAGGGAAVFNSAATLGGMSAKMVGDTGGSQPHNNQQPYLVMTWCIALVGIFPSRN
ncbi:MAG TPA: tail fiber protein [Terracidiphilus sp.]|nr:tail fiber protein [Terracidiphilus sp.]